jgi:hypothetical protein
MQGSFAAFDLFLFCILGSILDYTKNPAHVLGMGLALHVFGVLLGMTASRFLSSTFGTTIAGASGLLLVFAAFYCSRHWILN